MGPLGSRQSEKLNVYNVPNCSRSCFLSEGDIHISPYHVERAKGVFADFNIQICGVINMLIRLKLNNLLTLKTFYPTVLIKN